MQVKNNIQRVFIHAGMHKTGSTSIQYSMGYNKEFLACEGILYPDFSYRKELFNHSVPLYHACFDHRDNYQKHYQDRKKTKKSKSLNENYLKQLLEQVDHFNGDKLIFSAENLSTWKYSEILKLKDLISEYMGDEISVSVIIYVRHPVDWAQSFVPQQVIDGKYTLEDSLKSVYRIVVDKYKDSIDKYVKVFGKENVWVNRLEDVVTETYGIVGHFLELIGFSKDKIKSVNMKKVNKSKSAASIELVSEINDKIPYEIRKNLNLYPLVNIPGRKYQLSQKAKEKIWELSYEDINWLCENFNLKPYILNDDEANYTERVWNHENVIYIGKIFDKLDSRIKHQLLNNLYNE